MDTLQSLTMRRAYSNSLFWLAGGPTAEQKRYDPFFAMRVLEFDVFTPPHEVKRLPPIDVCQGLLMKSAFFG